MLLSLVGCTNRERLFVGDVGGRRLQVQSVQRSNPMSTQVWVSLRWGDLPAIDIDHDSTSAGPPYSLSIYGSAPVAVADQAEAAYQNVFVPLERSVPVPVMLYLDPARFSRAQFDQYAAFFRDHWPQVAQGIRLDQGYRNVVVVGLVHGRDADFLRRFERAGGGGAGRLVVRTNGDVHLERGTSLSSTNLSRKIQMPGFQVVLQPGGELTFEQLRGYRDASGNAFTDLFDVVEEP